MDKSLIDAAQGLRVCDVNLIHCTVIDVLGGRILQDATVSIKGSRVAGINDGLTAARSIDLEGRYLAPGFIDAHVHIESSMLCPPEYARVVLPHGTTSIVADPHEIANVLGYDGMRFMLNASASLPLDVYFMVPSCVPATGFDTAGAALYASDMYPFLREPRVLGLGEVMNYPGVLAQEPPLMDKLALFKDAGKAIDGHAPGLSGGRLSAYIAAGIGSDHECTSAAEAVEKAAKGMYIMLREGSTTKDINNLLPAITPRTIDRFMLCSDDRHPDDLKDEGHMDHAVRLLLKGGVPPLDALRIACFNATRWFGLKDQGAIAPGYKADFIVFSSFDDFRVEQVFKAGILVARGGELLQPIAPLTAPLRDSVNIKWLTLEDFHIPDKGRSIHIIEARPESVITGNIVEKPTVEAGMCVSDTARDLIKIFVIERHAGTGNIGKGFIRGLGLKRGALGSTVSHDSHNMILAGVDDQSIFKAARHLNKLKGGLVFTIGDELILDLPLPVAGLMSDRDAEFVIARLHEFEALFRREGLGNPSPLMTLSFMGLPVIPALKITDKGLVDVEKFMPIALYA